MVRCTIRNNSGNIMTRAIDLAGQRFGRLHVRERAGSAKHGASSHALWLCDCDCGSVITVYGICLRRGTTSSCGCYKNETVRQRWEAYREDAKNFWAHVEKSETGCWNWAHATNAGGYGILGFGGKRHRSHRLSWILHNGEIPKGMMVLHKCDNRRCVNPDHLYLGTATENMRDVQERMRRIGVGGAPKLDKSIVADIRREHSESDITMTALARRYQVSVATISEICNYRTWQWVTQSKF